MSKLGSLFFCWQRDIHNKCNTELEFFTFSNFSFDIEHNAWDSGRIERCTIWDPHLISCQRLSCWSLLLLLIHCIFTFCHWQNCTLDKYDNKLLNWPRPAYFERQCYIRSPLFHNIWQNPIDIRAKQWSLFKWKFLRNPFQGSVSIIVVVVFSLGNWVIDGHYGRVAGARARRLSSAQMIYHKMVRAAPSP